MPPGVSSNPQRAHLSRRQIPTRKQSEIVDIGLILRSREILCDSRAQKQYQNYRSRNPERTYSSPKTARLVAIYLAASLDQTQSPYHRDLDCRPTHPKNSPSGTAPPSNVSALRSYRRRRTAHKTPSSIGISCCFRHSHGSQMIRIRRNRRCLWWLSIKKADEKWDYKLEALVGIFPLAWSWL